MTLTLLAMWDDLGGLRLSREEQVAALDLLYHETCIILDFVLNNFKTKYYHTNIHLIQFVLVYGAIINFSSSVLECYNGVHKRIIERQTNKKSNFGTEFKGAHFLTKEMPMNRDQRALTLPVAQNIMETLQILQKFQEGKKDTKLIRERKIIWEGQEMAEIAIKFREFLEEQIKKEGNTEKEKRTTTLDFQKAGIQIHFQKNTNSDKPPKNKKRNKEDLLKHSTPTNILFEPPNEKYVWRKDFICKTTEKDLFNLLNQKFHKIEHKIADMKKIFEEEIDY